jgi:hypothetical protein
MFYSNVLYIPFECPRRDFRKLAGLHIQLLDINFNITKPIFLYRPSDLKPLRRLYVIQVSRPINLVKAVFFFITKYR